MKHAPPSRRDRLRHMLADLRLPGALEALDAILQGVDGGALTTPEAIEQLLSAQIQLRNNRRLQAAMRSSRLPAVKQLHDFDFTFQPSLRREQIESLHELGFVERAENVILLGPPGVGKTHLAISLAIAAAQSGRRVYYGTLADLIISLEEAQAAGRLQARLKVLTHPALLVVDEIGYLPISRTGAMLFWVPGAIREDFAPSAQYDTSNGNHFKNNRMGFHPSGVTQPNGIDFSWDEQGVGNCWQDNVSSTGTVTQRFVAGNGCSRNSASVTTARVPKDPTTSLPTS